MGVGVVTGAEMIVAERQRQIEREGWTAEHDDEHNDGELLDAAHCYLETVRLFHLTPFNPRSFDWPWELAAWKPSSDDPIRNLVKAAALIAAEIDRLQR